MNNFYKSMVYRRTRRVRRRRAGRRRTRRARQIPRIRRLRRNGNIISIKKTLPPASITVTGDSYQYYSWNLNELFNEENDLGPLFRWYRIRGVKLRFMWTGGVVVQPNTRYGFMYFLRNTSATNTQNGTSGFYFLNANPAVRRLDKVDGTKRSTWYVRVKPQMYNPPDATLNTANNVTTRNSQWFSTDSAGMSQPYRGADVFVAPGLASTGTLDVWATFYVQFKAAR